MIRVSSKLRPGQTGRLLAVACVVFATCEQPSPVSANQSPWGIAQCSSFDPDDDKHYQLYSPNGGEVYFVGDTVVIKACSEDPGVYNLDDMEKQISVDGGLNWIVFYTEDHLDTSPGEKHWIIPDSVEYLDDQANLQKVCIVTDSAFLRVCAYGEPSEFAVDFDRSDSSFAIRRQTKSP